MGESPSPNHAPSKTIDLLMDGLTRREIHPDALTKLVAWIVFITELHEQEGPLNPDERAAQQAAFRLSDAIHYEERHT